MRTLVHVDNEGGIRELRKSMRQHLLQLHGAGELTPALMFPTWGSGGLGIRTCPKFQWRATARAPIDDSSGFRKLGRRFRRKMSAATWRNPYLMLPTWVGGLGLHACHIGKYSTKTPKTTHSSINVQNPQNLVPAQNSSMFAESFAESFAE